MVGNYRLHPTHDKLHSWEHSRLSKIWAQQLRPCATLQAGNIRPQLCSDVVSTTTHFINKRQLPVSHTDPLNSLQLTTIGMAKKDTPPSIGDGQWNLALAYCVPPNNLEITILRKVTNTPPTWIVKSNSQCLPAWPHFSCWLEWQIVFYFSSDLDSQ